MTSLSLAWQGAPPFCGDISIARLRRLVPPPQEQEQPLHSPHSPQMQSIGRGGAILHDASSLMSPKHPVASRPAGLRIVRFLLATPNPTFAEHMPHVLQSLNSQSRECEKHGRILQGAACFSFMAEQKFLRDLPCSSSRERNFCPPWQVRSHEDHSDQDVTSQWCGILLEQPIVSTKLELHSLPSPSGFCRTDLCLIRCMPAAPQKLQSVQAESKQSLEMHGFIWHVWVSKRELSHV
mmetsp:Transcript_73961/g.173492  ORF Transcript_73961/g.173492 Transcript_73961/m.173492 type:complete len:237 (-) Transcript_73961:197-907(-)